MALSVGIGDGIALAGVIKGIIGALRDTGGAGEQHTELMCELRSFELVLDRARAVRRYPELDAEFQLLEINIKECQRAISRFEERTRPFGKRLSGPGPIAWWAKIDWGIVKKDRVDEFRKVLLGHRMNIQFIMNVIQLQTNTLLAKRHEEHGQQLRNLSGFVKSNFEFLWRKIVVISNRIADIGDQGAVIIALLMTLCQKLQQIFALLQVSAKMLHFQDPVRFLDATGRTWPMYLEAVWNREGLKGLLRGNFINIDGAAGKIDRGEFAIEDSDTRRDIDLEGPWEACFSPGQRVEMSMVFSDTGEHEMYCPMCKDAFDQAQATSHVCAIPNLAFRTAVVDASYTSYLEAFDKARGNWRRVRVIQSAGSESTPAAVNETFTAPIVHVLEDTLRPDQQTQQTKSTAIFRIPRAPVAVPLFYIEHEVQGRETRRQRIPEDKEPVQDASLGRARSSLQKSETWKKPASKNKDLVTELNAVETESALGQDAPSTSHPAFSHYNDCVPPPESVALYSQHRGVRGDPIFDLRNDDSSICLQPGCNKSFARAADLQRHYSTIHATDYELIECPLDGVDGLATEASLDETAIKTTYERSTSKIFQEEDDGLEDVADIPGFSRVS